MSSNRKSLYIMVGIPGSGKSTWLKNNVINPKAAIVSRDVIRYALLKEEDNYFDKESLVYNRFIMTIHAALSDSNIDTVYADATHLTIRSRAKILNALKGSIARNNVDVFAVYFDISFKTCMERNALREGRACVPSAVMRRMNEQFEIPTVDEGFQDIIVIKERE